MEKRSTLLQVAVNKPNANPQSDQPELFIVSSDCFVDFLYEHSTGVVVVQGFPDSHLVVSDDYLQIHSV